MADDKRNRPDQPQQGDNQQPGRQRDKERRPGGGSIESPDSDRPRREDETEPQR